MYRFYVSADQLAEKEVFISGGDVNHIKNVLRLEVGDWIVACDGNGTDYRGFNLFAVMRLLRRSRRFSPREQNCR